MVTLYMRVRQVGNNEGDKEDQEVHGSGLKTFSPSREFKGQNDKDSHHTEGQVVKTHQVYVHPRDHIRLANIYIINGI